MRTPTHLIALGLGAALLMAAPAPATPKAEAPRTMIYSSAEEIEPLEAGDTVPHPVFLRDKEGSPVILRSVLEGKGRTVLVFYRGGWLPYCNNQLSGLAVVQEELERHGVEVIAFSPDRPQKIAGYMEERELPYTILSDSAGTAMAAFGVGFTVDGETVEQLRGYGLDLAEWSGHERNILPVPAVFVVNEEQEIVFAHAEPDYTKRLGREELLRAAGIGQAEEEQEQTETE